jgi:hypothetical protein
MAPSGNMRWPHTTLLTGSTSGPKRQYRWPPQAQILNRVRPFRHMRASQARRAQLPVPHLPGQRRIGPDETQRDKLVQHCSPCNVSLEFCGPVARGKAGVVLAALAHQ